MSEASPFHAGELEVQERLGVRDEIGPWARKVVRDRLTEQHRSFYAELPFLVAAARDGAGRPWATLLVGEPGFASAASPERLAIRAQPAPGDALVGAFAAGADVGLLGIELATRRRNRVNGRVAEADDTGIVLAVQQAFGNCPQYIREREWRRIAPSAATPRAERARGFGRELREWIAGADTFFIATGHRGEGQDAAFGLDASHRGGPVGFVEVASDTALVFPDYAGNNHFNTLGNLLLDDRAGLLFVDFERGGLLQLTGRARVDWDPPAAARDSGARRLVRFELDEAVIRREALPLRWLGAREPLRSLRVVGRQRESDDVVSFVLAARDGGALPDHEAGQHLPVEIRVAGAREPLRRSYSLSSGPGDGVYRISVKREPAGTVSRLLHAAIGVDDVLDARAPGGDFVLPDHDRPLALVSAGIGVTPMVAMLRELAARGDARPVAFVHAARDGRHHPFAAEVRALVAHLPGARQSVHYSRPGAGDVAGRDFDVSGRLHADQLFALLPAGDPDVFLCGPVGFMAEMQSGLEARGIARERIHVESFGPHA